MFHLSTIYTLMFHLSTIYTLMFHLLTIYTLMFYLLTIYTLMFCLSRALFSFLYLKDTTTHSLLLPVSLRHTHCLGGSCVPLVSDESQTVLPFPFWLLCVIHPSPYCRDAASLLSHPGTLWCGRLIYDCMHHLAATQSRGSPNILWNTRVSPSLNFIFIRDQFRMPPTETVYRKSSFTPTCE